MLCLDSIGTGDDLYLHVSKPPREDTAGGTFVQVMEILMMPGPGCSKRMTSFRH